MRYPAKHKRIHNLITTKHKRRNRDGGPVWKVRRRTSFQIFTHHYPHFNLSKLQRNLLFIYSLISIAVLTGSPRVLRCNNVKNNNNTHRQTAMNECCVVLTRTLLVQHCFKCLYFRAVWSLPGDGLALALVTYPPA